MTFFHAIQVSSVAIGLLAFSSFPVFVTLMEPLLFKERWRSLDLLTTVIVVAGLYLVVPLGESNPSAVEGLVWGVISALLFAILSLANRSRVKKTDTVSLSFLQNTGAGLTAALFVATGTGTGRDDTGNTFAADAWYFLYNTTGHNAPEQPEAYQGTTAQHCDLSGTGIRHRTGNSSC